MTRAADMVDDVAPHDKNNCHNEFGPIGPYAMGYLLDHIYYLGLAHKQAELSLNSPFKQ
jgi:hypothetical protein